MTLLRPSSTTTQIMDSIKASIARVSVTLSGVTTVQALANADAEILRAITGLRELRLSLKGDQATAKRQSREDRDVKMGRAGL